MNAPRKIRLAASMALALVVPLGCTVIAGVDGDYEPAVMQDSTCPKSTETDPCFICTDENCCVEYAACENDPRCGDYYKSCIPDCKMQGKTYDACVVECDGKVGAGHVLFAPYLACGELHCLQQCGGGEDDPCKNCLYASCRDQMTACRSDADCDTLFSCAALCPTTAGHDACVAMCEGSRPEAATEKYAALIACGVSGCVESCTQL